MSHPLPKITIKYNRFLDPIFIGWIQSQEKYKDWIPPDKEEVLKNIQNYNALWNKYSEQVLLAMTEITGLHFKRNLIPVYIVSGNPRGFSDPIVLKSRYTDIEFINYLTHELIHCLYVDNCARVNDAIPYDAPNLNDTAKDHVYLHAILKYIFLDILKEPGRLVVAIDNCNKSKGGYELAWQIVENGNYLELINGFKSKIKRG